MSAISIKPRAPRKPSATPKSPEAIQAAPKRARKTTPAPLLAIAPVEQDAAVDASQPSTAAVRPSPGRGSMAVPVVEDDAAARPARHLAAVPDTPEADVPEPELTPAIAARRRAHIELASVLEMNERHACVRVGGNVLIVAEDDDGRHSLTTFRALSEWLACHPLFVPAASERTGRVESRRVDRAMSWRGHPQRRNVKGLEFAPARDLGPDYYNLWKGWGLAPAYDDGAAARLILDHIRDTWCQGDKTLAHWVLSWFAQLVQEPCRKPGTALVLRGEEGTGKGVIAGVLMRRIVASAHVQILHPGQVTGRFNAIWQSKLFVFADESFWAGDKPSEGVLKGLITEDKLNVEFKGKDVFEIDHHARVVFASNNDWVVPAGPTARRYCVLDVASTYRGDDEYHSALKAAVEGDGAASFFGFLMRYDYSGVNLRQPPTTAALLDQKMMSLDSVPAWWRERLWAGYLDDPQRRHDAEGAEDTEWRETVLCGRLFASYAAYCKRTSVRYPEGEESFARKLREFAPLKRKHGPRENGSRPWLYQFGTDGVSCLHFLRGHFEKWIGGALTWAGDEPEEDRDAEDDARAERTAASNAVTGMSGGGTREAPVHRHAASHRDPPRASTSDEEIPW